jgi:hypothetical protein
VQLSLYLIAGLERSLLEAVKIETLLSWDYGIQLLSSVLYSTVSLKEIRERDAGQIVFKVLILRVGGAMFYVEPRLTAVSHIHSSLPHQQPPHTPALHIQSSIMIIC